MRPIEAGEHGGVRVTGRGRIGKVSSTSLLAWLRSKGVPDEPIPAKWQAQTQSIVGQFKPAAQKPA
jgi:hypothetical protein